MTDKTYTKQELEEVTNALLAEDNKKKKAEAKAAEQSQAEAETKEDDKSKEKGKLDDKTIASLPAAALIMANEKLRDMLVKGKKKGKLDSSEVSDVLDEMDLESEQMDRIYDHSTDGIRGVEHYRDSYGNAYQADVKYDHIYKNGNTFVASTDGSLQLGPDWEELKK